MILRLYVLHNYMIHQHRESRDEPQSLAVVPSDTVLCKGEREEERSTQVSAGVAA